MKKLGVMVPDLGPSQLNYYFISNANQLSEAHEADVVGFYETLIQPCLPVRFATMQFAEAWNYDGILIATTFSSAQRLINFPAASKKLFMVWDLEWIASRKSYAELRSVYGSTDLTLVARSISHAQAISQCFNREVLIVEDFDLKSMIEICNK